MFPCMTELFMPLHYAACNPITLCLSGAFGHPEIRAWRFAFATTIGWKVYENHRKIIGTICKAALVMFGLFLWKICGKTISKLEVALFCFLGPQSNTNLMD